MWTPAQHPANITWVVLFPKWILDEDVTLQGLRDIEELLSTVLEGDFVLTSWTTKSTKLGPLIWPASVLTISASDMCDTVRREGDSVWWTVYQAVCTAHD